MKFKNHPGEATRIAVSQNILGLCLERDLCKGQKTENFPQLKGYILGQRMKFKNRPGEATRIDKSYKPLTHMPPYVQ